MSEFEFTKDYRGAFAVALKENNVAQMQKVFEQLADEVGLENPVRDDAQIAAAKATAAKLNAIAGGTAGGKKI